MQKIIEEIIDERNHQEKKWGAIHDDKIHNSYSWNALISHYLAKAIEPFISIDTENIELKGKIFRYNMIKVAALAVAAIEANDRMLEKNQCQKKNSK